MRVSAVPAVALSIAAFGGAAVLPVASASAAKAKTTTLKLSVGSGLSYNTKSLSAKAGTIVIKFTNASKTGHDVAVAKGTKVIGQTKVFTGGTQTLTLKNVKAGSYVFYCTVPGHRQAGMEGTLKVTG